MKPSDEFNWSTYTGEYSQQIAAMGEDFLITEHGVNPDGSLDFKDRLHPNWMEIYNAAWTLKPKSILEIGCGGCYNLRNLKLILPDTDVTGVDLLQSQIDYGRTFAKLQPEVRTWVSDFTDDSAIPDERFDFVFTQAVVMHLSTENAFKFMRNVLRVASKHVLLVENPGHHEGWRSMVESVFSGWKLEVLNRFVSNGAAILLTRPD